MLFFTISHGFVCVLGYKSSDWKVGFFFVAKNLLLKLLKWTSMVLRFDMGFCLRVWKRKDLLVHSFDIV